MFAKFSVQCNCLSGRGDNRHSMNNLIKELEFCGCMCYNNRTYNNRNNTKQQEEMTQQELDNIIKTLKAIPESNDDMARTILKAAADSITLKRIKSLTGESNEIISQSDGGSDVLAFSRKEIDSMPRTFRKQFRTKGITAHVRKRPSGKHKYNFEIRCQVNLQKIAVSSNSLEDAKRKFIKRLEEIDAGVVQQKSNGVPTTFDKFANYYFEKFHKRKVSASAYRVAMSNYKNHVLPHFGDMPLKQITADKCQALLDRLIAEDKPRTEENVHSMLNMLFKAAIKHGILQHNPIDMVFHTKHAREHGKALTKDEEQLLLSSTAGTPYQKMFAIGLYTGLRPNEYKTAVIQGDFIIANNSKRKNGKKELKKIPITPMLAPYLEDTTELYFTRLEQIRNKFNKILPNHKLYDLRTTFYTRCTECGIAEAAIKEYVGHALGGLADTYTDLSDDFLRAEGRKFLY